MDTGAVVSAMIAWYVETYRDNSRATGTTSDRPMMADRWDTLVHLVTIVYGWDEYAATEWLSEEVQERYAAMAD